MSDRAIGLLLIVVSAFFYWQTYFFKTPPFAAFQQMGAEFFPRGILIALGILGLALTIRGEGSPLPNWTVGRVRAALVRYREVILSLALFPLYGLSVGLIGFFASTVIYLIVMQLILRPRRGLGLLYVAAGSLAFTWALVALFQGYLHVVLPSGSLF